MNLKNNVMFLVVCSAVLALSSTNADDWPRFRGPDGHAASSDSVPAEWTESENIAWKSKIPGRGSSSPIIVGDQIFLTSYTGYGQSDDDAGEKTELRLNTLCFDRKTGKLIWNHSIEASADEQPLANPNSRNGKKKQVAGHGYASSTPVSDGESVFAFFGASGAVAYD